MPYIKALKESLIQDHDSLKRHSYRQKDSLPSNARHRDYYSKLNKLHSNVTAKVNQHCDVTDNECRNIKHQITNAGKELTLAASSGESYSNDNFPIHSERSLMNIHSAINHLHGRHNVN